MVEREGGMAKPCARAPTAAPEKPAAVRLAAGSAEEGRKLPCSMGERVLGVRMLGLTQGVASQPSVL